MASGLPPTVEVAVRGALGMAVASSGACLIKAVLDRAFVVDPWMLVFMAAWGAVFGFVWGALRWWAGSLGVLFFVVALMPGFSHLRSQSGWSALATQRGVGLILGAAFVALFAWALGEAVCRVWGELRAGPNQR